MQEVRGCGRPAGKFGGGFPSGARNGPGEGLSPGEGSRHSPSSAAGGGKAKPGHRLEGQREEEEVLSVQK